MIEVLVALAILAVALAAAVRAGSIAADGTVDLKERLLATWVAQDRLASHATLQPSFPDTGSRQGNVQQAGLDFVWRETVSGTPNPRFRRIEIQVATARAPTHTLSTLVGYAARSE